MDFATLKAQQHSERDQLPECLALRIHCALSWLQRAELEDDGDGRFIFLWIAFNAAYATDIDPQYRFNEHDASKAFLGKLCDLDTSKQLEQLVWQHYPQAIRVLLDNLYVFQSYWDHQRGQISAEEWKERFEAGKHNAAKALSINNTAAVLGTVFNRFYTLRNQMLGDLVPVISALCSIARIHSGVMRFIRWFRW